MEKKIKLRMITASITGHSTSILLCLIGILSLYVALTHDPNGPSVTRGVGMQIIWYLVGAVAIAIVMRINSKWIWKLTPLSLWTRIACHGVALTIFTTRIWRQVPVQKLVVPFWKCHISTSRADEDRLYILMLALIVTKHNTQVKVRTIKSDFWLIAKMLIISIPVIALVMAQKTLGRCSSFWRSLVASF